MHLYISSCRAASTDFIDSLGIRLYHPSLPTCPLDYIVCPYRAVIDRLRLVVQHFLVRMKGSTGERCLSLFLLLQPFRHMSCPSYLDGFRDRR